MWLSFKFFLTILLLLPVLPKREEPKAVEPEEESFLPQWGIAVIVIAMASLLFVVIFGVTVVSYHLSIFLYRPKSFTVHIDAEFNFYFLAGKPTKKRKSEAAHTA